jgi:hypothetical protein
MINLQSQLYHLHGGDLVPMSERDHHDPADHDIERALARGARVFRCDRCEEEILLVPPGDEIPPEETLP